jgi:hypothetical protein
MTVSARTAIPSFCPLGLSPDECHTIAEAGRRLPGEWSVVFEAVEDGAVFARLLPPGSDGQSSAFLIERHGDRVILTDRLSDELADAFTRHPDVADALEAAEDVIFGITRIPASRLTPTSAH